MENLNKSKRKNFESDNNNVEPEVRNKRKRQDDGTIQIKTEQNPIGPLPNILKEKKGLVTKLINDSYGVATVPLPGIGNVGVMFDTCEFWHEGSVLVDKGVPLHNVIAEGDWVKMNAVRMLEGDANKRNIWYLATAVVRDDVMTDEHSDQFLALRQLREISQQKQETFFVVLSYLSSRPISKVERAMIWKLYDSTYKSINDPKPRNSSLNEIKHLKNKDSNVRKEDGEISSSEGEEHLNTEIENKKIQTIQKSHTEVAYEDPVYTPLIFPTTNPNDYWHLIPIKVKPVSLSLFLSHLGMENMISPKAIEYLHDRSKITEIKYFLRINQGVCELPNDSKPVIKKDGSVCTTPLSSKWKKAGKMFQVIDGLHAYVAVMGLLHPYDYGPMNILRNLNHWQFFMFRGANQLHSTIEVINAVLAVNANRAGQRIPPLTMDELDDLFRGTLRSLGGQSTLPEEYNHDIFAFKLKEPTLSVTKTPGSLKKKSKLADNTKFDGICFEFNKAKGCPRAPTEEKCVLTDPVGYIRTFSHCCSFKPSPSATICGKSHSEHEYHGQLSKKLKRKKNKLIICPQFNKAEGCPREPAGNSCIRIFPNGFSKPMSHCCSFKPSPTDSFCGKSHSKHGNHDQQLLNPAKRTTHIMEGICPQFNKAKGCPRAPTEKSCIKTFPTGVSITFSHICSFKPSPSEPYCGKFHSKVGNHDSLKVCKEFNRAEGCPRAPKEQRCCIPDANGYEFLYHFCSFKSYPSAPYCRKFHSEHGNHLTTVPEQYNKPSPKDPHCGKSHSEHGNQGQQLLNPAQSTTPLIMDRICPQFNKAKGCPRAPTEKSCIKISATGVSRTLRHICSFKTSMIGSICGEFHSKYENHGQSINEANAKIRKRQKKHSPSPETNPSKNPSPAQPSNHHPSPGLPTPVQLPYQSASQKKKLSKSIYDSMCSEFNSAKGCHRDPRGDSCIITGADGIPKTLLHLCNFRMSPLGKFCGKSHSKNESHSKNPPPGPPSPWLPNMQNPPPSSGPPSPWLPNMQNPPPFHGAPSPWLSNMQHFPATTVLGWRRDGHGEGMEMCNQTDRSSDPSPSQRGNQLFFDTDDGDVFTEIDRDMLNNQ